MDAGSWPWINFLVLFRSTCVSLRAPQLAVSSEIREVMIGFLEVLVPDFSRFF